jgi:hypothetical protein
VRTRVARPGGRIEMLEGGIESDGPSSSACMAAILWLRSSTRMEVRARRARFGPAVVWTRPRAALIAGEPQHPLDRALLIADSANGISRELAMDEWLFVPSSPSLALERYPEGEWT